MARRLLTALIITGIAGICLSAEPATQPDGKTAAAQNPATQPTTKPVVVKAYDPIVERVRFFKAAGTNGELDQKEFDANKGKKYAFVQTKDTWAAMLGFDKNNNKSIDWFEADAYRRSKRPSGILTRGGRSGDGALSGRGMPDGAGRGQDGNRNRWPLSAEETKKYDADGDGRLNRQERRAAYSARGEDMRKRLEKKYDANGDGKLDESEHKTMFDEFRKEATERMDSQLKRRHDKDGDGKLNAEEQAAFDQARKELIERIDRIRKDTQNRRKELLDKYDTDKDGQLSREERRAAREASRKEFMDKWDKDKDGQLSGEERQAARAAGDRGPMRDIMMDDRGGRRGRPDRGSSGQDGRSDGRRNRGTGDQAQQRDD